MVKIIAAILAVIMILLIGYTVVAGVINLFKGYSIGDAFAASWNEITHLWGLIKEKVEADVIYPMANSNITWTYARASNPR
jgi:hypothetical protein